MPDYVWWTFILVAFFSGVSLGILIGFVLGVRYVIRVAAPILDKMDEPISFT